MVKNYIIFSLVTFWPVDYLRLLWPQKEPSAVDSEKMFLNQLERLNLSIHDLSLYHTSNWNTIALYSSLLNPKKTTETRIDNIPFALPIFLTFRLPYCTQQTLSIKETAILSWWTAWWPLTIVGQFCIQMIFRNDKAFS